jgi:antitoxin component of MazEF toxin-antitoxin module
MRVKQNSKFDPQYLNIRTKLNKRGNSISITIPSHIIKELELKPDNDIGILIHDIYRDGQYINLVELDRVT